MSKTVCLHIDGFDGQTQIMDVEYDGGDAQAVHESILGLPPLEGVSQKQLDYGRNRRLKFFSENKALLQRGPAEFHDVIRLACSRATSAKWWIEHSSVRSLIEAYALAEYNAVQESLSKAHSGEKK